LKRSSIDIRAGIPWRDLPERFGDWKIVGGHVPSQDRSETFGDW
jgi:transposase